MILPLTSEQQLALLSMRPSDTWRDGQVIRLNGIISKVIFAIKNFFSGGWAQNDQKAFTDFYARIKENITHLNKKLDSEEDLDELFPQIKQMLEIQAKISNSAWIKKVGSFKPYGDYLRDIEALGQKASAKIGPWEGKNPLERLEIGRWIRSNKDQRRFAAYLNLNQVPYRYEEIPKGAVILTDPFLYLLNERLRKHGHILKKIFFHIKAFLCWLGTGKVYTHAELSLGDGNCFDLDKKQGCWITGKMRIADRKGRVCYGAVVVPNEQEMLRKHQATEGIQHFTTFETLLKDIEKEAIQSQPKIEARWLDIIQTAVPFRRSTNYQCTLAWEPGVKGYGCSATVSALFSKYGIDIGEEFNRQDQNVSPGMFLSSRYFKPLFVVN